MKFLGQIDEFTSLHPPVEPKEEGRSSDEDEKTKKDKETNFPLMGPAIPPFVEVMSKGKSFFIS